MRADACLSFARRGPLFSHLPAATAAEDWARHGGELASELYGCPPADSPEQLGGAAAARIFHLYLPIYFWCRAFVQGRRAADPRRAVGIGLSAPQGCGKTTLVDALVGRFAADGLVCTAASIDDFYLPRADQQALADAHPENRLVQVRGNAGTHDVDLGVATLSALLSRTPGLAVPRYDKAAFGGRGDRASPSAWHVQREPADVVLFEGWMNGFEALDMEAEAARLDAIDGGLREVNQRLSDYARWHGLMSAWVVVKIDDLDHVYRWRLEAERAMAAAGRPGMDDAGVADFVSRYMPAYKAYLPGLYQAASAGGVGGLPTLLATVDGSRGVAPAAVDDAAVQL